MATTDVNLYSFGTHGIDVSDCDADACREFADHLRDVAGWLERGEYGGAKVAGGTAEKVLARCTPTDGNDLAAADPAKIREFAADYESAAEAIALIG